MSIATQDDVIEAMKWIMKNIEDPLLRKKT